MKRFERGADRIPGPSGFPVYVQPLALALAILPLLMLLVAGARAEGQTMYVCTATDPLNVREEPNPHSPWLYQLDRGEAVEVLDEYKGWAYIAWTGQYGWCWAEYLADKPPADGLPEGWLDVEPD